MLPARERSSWTTPLSSLTASSGNVPTSAHIAGPEFLNRDVDESKVNCDRSCDWNLRRIGLHVLPLQEPVDS